MSTSIKLRDKTKSFISSMENGAIYFEYSDGYTIAMHRSLYNCEGEDPTNNLNYKNFIEKLSTDNRVRYLTKFYYKVDNLDDPGNNNQEIWIDLKKVSNNTSGNIYRYAYDYRNTISLQVSISKIKAVTYIDKNYNVYTIDHHDGKIYNNEIICNNIKIHTRDKRYVDVSRYSLNNPTTNKEYLKEDIKIELKDVDSIYYNESLNNTLIWLNGKFVEPSISSENEKLAYLVKGISGLDYQHIGFIGNNPLIPCHNSGYQVATYEPEFSRYKYGPDFDICVFKWENINISNWIRPFSYDYKNYNYSDGEGFNFTIKYAESISFPVTEIPESHIIIHNGVILGKDTYYIKDNKIILNGMRNKVDSVITSSIEEYGKIDAITYVIKKHLPKPENFKLIIFSHTNPIKTAKLNRSTICYKNHPYPFHVTFPDLKVGDLVLLDGIYERYLLHDKNIIKYPYTKYLARYSSRNLMNETVIERLWFSEV